MPESMHEFVIAQLQARIQARTTTYKEIADGCGLSVRTVEKIARREIEDPGVSLVEKLAAYFRKPKTH